MLKFTLLGFGLGGIYAISALGIVTIYRGSRMLNLAHGGIALWGAHLFIQLRDEQGLHGGAAAALALAAAAVFGAVLYLVAFRPLRERTELTKLVASLGALVALQSLAVREMGTASRLVRSSLPNDPVTVLGATVGRDRLILFGLGVGVAGALALWSRRSRFALATLAQARHEEAAASLGYSPVLLGSANWALGSALAALAGILIAPLAGHGVRGAFVVVVPALAAGLIGRFESYGLAVVGGLLLGVAEAQVTRYVTMPGWSTAAPLLVVVVFLLVRRNVDLNRLAATPGAAVGSGRVRLGVAIPLLAVALLSTFALPDRRLDGLTSSFIFAILALSLVVLIGYTNQISLAQMAIAGMGALVAARMTMAWGLPFELAPLVGALTGAAIGLLAGLPALRIRGMNLAVITLALAVTAERAVFENATFSGGFNGLPLEPPTFFGSPVDAVTHPAGYARVVLVWLVVALGGVSAVRRSRFGRRMLAVRSNERAAAAQGISVAQTKLLAFTVSSALAGMAGVLLGFRQRTVVFEGFGLFLSIEVIALSVLAGIGTLGGALLAGLIAPAGLLFTFFPTGGLIDQYSGLLFGVNLIVVLLMHPSGVLGPRASHSDAAHLEVGPAPVRPPAGLSLDAVSVRYGGVAAATDVSLEVRPGEVVGLIGPNGAGKTTVLDAISGFARTSGGAIRLGELDLTRHPPAARAHAGVARVFQSLELIDDLSVGGNVALGAVAGSGGHPKVSPLSLALLEEAGLLDRLEARPGELSLGARRVVAIARALASNPAVVLLDEPAAGLSSEESAALVPFLRRMAAEGLAVLLVEHDIEVVWKAADRIVVLVDGRNFAAGHAEAIARHEGVRDVYLGRPAVKDAPA